MEAQYKTPHSTCTDDEQLTIDNQLMFEMIKLEIRGQTIKYCSELKRKGGKTIKKPNFKTGNGDTGNPITRNITGT